MSETILGTPPNVASRSERIGIMGGPATAVVPRPTPIMIQVNSPESIGPELRNMGQASPSAPNYPAANLAIFVPFGIAERITVVKMFVQNSSPVAGNIDMGIYKPDGTLVVSKGSTAHAGTNTIQELDITDTVLEPGRYYMAIASDTSGVGQKMICYALSVAAFGVAMGVYQQATAFPLPSPATFATFAQTAIPIFGLSTRSLVV